MLTEVNKGENMISKTTEEYLKTIYVLMKQKELLNQILNVQIMFIMNIYIFKKYMIIKREKIILEYMNLTQNIFTVQKIIQ